MTESWVALPLIERPESSETCQSNIRFEEMLVAQYNDRKT